MAHPKLSGCAILFLGDDNEAGIVEIVVFALPTLPGISVTFSLFFHAKSCTLIKGGKIIYEPGVDYFPGTNQDNA
jgi:hypothetical protein